jgi:hypothetical protein
LLIGLFWRFFSGLDQEAGSTKTPTCLLPAQITAMQKVFAGATDSQGNL